MKIKKFKMIMFINKPTPPPPNEGINGNHFKNFQGHEVKSANKFLHSPPSR